ncbi:MAG: FAD-dependent oxidoreductase [Burkholderiaceae bacterium]|jgi:predicted NAD/FAD-dependent oxidoreductase|nr:FAD-dependent oxidoreductase [Burkholderiaceae bacterium]
MTLCRRTTTTTSSAATTAVAATRRFAIVGAGIAGLVCARTLMQAGCDVQVHESASQPGGRLATLETPFGNFDTGTQYFTVRDSRLTLALERTAHDAARRWSANAVRVLDAQGRVIEAAPASHEAHWVGHPGMAALPLCWARPLIGQGRLYTDSRVTAVQRDAIHANRWQIHTENAQGEARVLGGFDAVIFATPHSRLREVLLKSALHIPLLKELDRVDAAPCWTLLLAFPNAVQPGLQTLGPQWNAAYSTHHRVAWLARESSKPGRAPIERWTVQASTAWSREHQSDDAERAAAKLLKAFGEITGIRATPAMAQTVFWRDAQTLQPLGQSFVWDAALNLGACGDWCLGRRVEDAFVSGLELALHLA